MAARRARSAHLSAVRQPGLLKGCSHREFKEENGDLCFCVLQIAKKVMLTLQRCQALLFPSSAAAWDLSTNGKTLSNVLLLQSRCLFCEDILALMVFLKRLVLRLFAFVLVALFSHSDQEA